MGVLLTTTHWEDGASVPLPDNTIQFKTNTAIIHPQTDFVINRQANVYFNLGTNGGVAMTNQSGYIPTVNWFSGSNSFEMNWGTVPDATGNTRVDTYFNLSVRPGHNGSPSVGNSETVLSAGQFAIAHERHLQIGLAGNTAAYTYMQEAQNTLSASQFANNSQPLFFRAIGRINGGPQVHYPGFYSTYVNTNGAHGTYYLALNFQQNAGFDAEDGTAWNIASSNETFRAWGGNSAELELLVPHSGATNAISTWPTESGPGGYAIVNSNATVYILTSTPNSTTWAATNKIAGP